MTNENLYNRVDPIFAMVCIINVNLSGMGNYQSKFPNSSKLLNERTDNVNIGPSTTA